MKEHKGQNTKERQHRSERKETKAKNKENERQHITDDGVKTAKERKQRNKHN